MLSPKQVSPIGLIIIGLILLLSASHQGHAADPEPEIRKQRAELTQATLELQRDILQIQAKLRAEQANLLAIYLFIDSTELKAESNLNVSIDEKIVIQTPIQQLDQQIANGIKPQIIPLTEGPHTARIDFQTGDKHDIKTLTFEKYDDGAYLKINITNTSSIITLEHVSNTASTYLQDTLFTSMAMLLATDKKAQPDKVRQQAQLLLANNFNELGLHDHAIDLYTQLTNAPTTNQAILDSAWLEKSRLYLQQENHELTVTALAKIKNKLGKNQTADYRAIQSRNLLALNKINPALDALGQINNDSTWALEQAFNLAVDLLNKHRNKNGALILHKISRLKADDTLEIQAIKDQANLALGFSLLKLKKAAQARNYLEKIRLRSHLSDIALLGLGWSHSIEGNYEQALIFWLELKNRPNISPYAYEAMLAVPYALSKATAYKQAIQHYEDAQRQINTDRGRLELAINNTTRLSFKNIFNAAPNTETGWLADWQNSLVTPLKYFVPLLLDNPEFQTMLRELRALLQLDNHMRSLQTEIKHLEAALKSKQLNDETTKLWPLQHQITEQIHQAIEQQTGAVQRQALSVLKRYKILLSTYSEEIKFGIAQTIEHSIYTNEDTL